MMFRLEQGIRFARAVEANVESSKFPKTFIIASQQN